MLKQYRRQRPQRAPALTLLRRPLRMRVFLTRKLAECIDGIDLTGCKVGDVLELPSLEARLLIAEQWAIRERRSAARGVGPRRYVSQTSVREQPDTHHRLRPWSSAARRSRKPPVSAARPQDARSASRSRGKPRS